MFININRFPIFFFFCRFPIFVILVFAGAPFFFFTISRHFSDSFSVFFFFFFHSLSMFTQPGALFNNS